jgi:hypothetical protein
MLLYGHREEKGQRHLQTTWASNSQVAAQLIDFPQFTFANPRRRIFGSR